MRLSYKADGLTHHIVEMWNYAATLHGVIACGAPWSTYEPETYISEEPATCIHCIVSPQSRKDTTYVNEDA